MDEAFTAQIEDVQRALLLNSSTGISGSGNSGINGNSNNGTNARRKKFNPNYKKQKHYNPNGGNSFNYNNNKSTGNVYTNLASSSYAANSGSQQPLMLDLPEIATLLQHRPLQADPSSTRYCFTPTQQLSPAGDKGNIWGHTW